MRSFIGGLICVLCAACAHAPKPEHQDSKTWSQAAHAARLFEEGRALAQAGDLTRAEQYLATALHEGHDPDQTLRVLLSVCVRSSRLRSAVAYAAPHLMAHPSNVRLRLLVASIALALGEVHTAERELRQVIARDGKAAQAEFLLATILARYSDRQGEAVEHFARYLELAPQGLHAEEAEAMLANEHPRSNTARLSRP